jgi:hypothetical protein
MHRAATWIILGSLVWSDVIHHRHRQVRVTPSRFPYPLHQVHLLGAIVYCSIDQNHVIGFQVRLREAVQRFPLQPVLGFFKQQLQELPSILSLSNQ